MCFINSTSCITSLHSNDRTKHAACVADALLVKMREITRGIITSRLAATCFRAVTRAKGVSSSPHRLRPTLGDAFRRICRSFCTTHTNAARELEKTITREKMSTKNHCIRECLIEQSSTRTRRCLARRQSQWPPAEAVSQKLGQPGSWIRARQTHTHRSVRKRVNVFGMPLPRALHLVLFLFPPSRLATYVDIYKPVSRRATLLASRERAASSESGNNQDRKHFARLRFSSARSHSVLQSRGETAPRACLAKSALRVTRCR